MSKKSCFWTCLLVTAALAGSIHAASLSPDDATIKDDLCLWLRRPEIHYDPQTWVWTDLSGKGNDARADVEGFAGPTVSSGENPAVFSHPFSTVHCNPQDKELLKTPGLNGGAGLTHLTIFSVVKVDVTGGTDQRAVGFGAYTDGDRADCFDMSFDLTVRKNNGYVSGKNQDLPLGEYVIYAARMDPDNINMWLNTTGTLSLAFSATGSSFTTVSDNFYVGELRYSPAGDFDVAEVVVYNTALTDAQVEGVCEWLQTHVGLGAGEGYPLAFGPDPRDGTMLEATTAILGWKAGDFAVSHDVYLGESFEEVSAATRESQDLFVGSTTDTSQLVGVPEALTPGQTYYWRIDEVNDTNAESPWKGNVWSFWVRPAIAWDPTPADEVKFVHTEQDLSWEIGIGTLFHTVYFGESFDEVNDAVAGGFMTADATYDPGPLAADTTYYWRVDEFAGTVPLKGDVWSFTTVPEVAVTDPNLTLWWTLDEAMGATAVDWSGHGYHGIVYGDAQWTDGYQGTALTFENDVYVEAADHPGITGTAPRTCCAWIKTTTANRTIMSWGQNVAGQKWRMRADATGGLRVEVNGGYHYGITNIADGRWHHVAVTFEDDGTPDALDTLLYVDGQLDATAASLDEPIDTAAGPVRIGESPWHNAPFLGQIDDARVYDKVLTAEEIQQVMRGNPLLAGDPQPGRGATVDIRDISVLSWSAGDTAASHDVYFGTDRDAVAAADKDAPEFQGNQVGASLSLPGLVEFGGGDYYWRIDEVEADGTVHAGSIWKFTVPAYLIVEDFESYSNDVGSRIFEVWIDGIGFTLPEPGHPGNGTGAAVGHDVWSVTSPHLDGTIMETANVYGGNQAMPLYYDNTFSPYYSETERAWTAPQNWTVSEVDTLTLYFRGASDNSPDELYVALEDSAGTVGVAVHPDPNAVLTTQWTEWSIPLGDFTGVNAAAVRTMYIGLGNRNAPIPGGTGLITVDEIRLTKPQSDNAQE